ncbi:hypothetical protein CPC08DRAFT_659349 [Agrocybe pediades]|nr:hypothetical protein CPC08DRAFT_659349 [Agrocybe pediades]
MDSPPFTPLSTGMLSPLTPIPSSPDPSPLKIIIKLKRPADPSTPVRRSKRSRNAIKFELSPDVGEYSPSSSSSTQCASSESEERSTIYTSRTLPDSIEISENFPLFYRRFPISSFYQPLGFSSPCTLFGVSHPGGVYNRPRSPLDLYTPRFVKGRGTDKVGLCPICVEPPERGGEKKKLWLAMKFSAFNYHMQYAHGISACTGRPFSPPTAFRIVPRPNPGKNEKTRIQQGKCHRCHKWIAVEGIKDMESKVKELYWWKHAATCHHDLSIEGDTHYYEEDAIFAKIQSLTEAIEAD